MYRGVLPFIALEFICLGAIMSWPDVALKLPELLCERVAKGTPYEGTYLACADVYL